MAQSYCGMLNPSWTLKALLTVSRLSAKGEYNCRFLFDSLPWMCYYLHITFAGLYFLKKATHHDYQSAYR